MNEEEVRGNSHEEMNINENVQAKVTRTSPDLVDVLDDIKNIKQIIELYYSHINSDTAIIKLIQTLS